MALTTCDECQGKVSDKALSCPHCGIKLGKSFPFKAVLYLIYALGIAYALYTISSTGYF